MFVQKFLRDYRSTIVPTIVDVDVAAATGALAATFETSGRGIIYEHQPSSISAQHLTTKLKASLDQALKQDHTLTNQNPAVVLRRTERAAQDAQKFFDADRTSYLDLIDRVCRETTSQSPSEQPTTTPTAEPHSGLIIP